MPKINFVGEIFGSSGYQNHLKGLANAVFKKNEETKLSVPLPNGWELVCNDAELKMINKQYFADGHTIMVAMPQHFVFGEIEPHGKLHGFCVWEGNRIPVAFIKELTRVDKIFVPSNHVKNAILNTVEGNDGDYIQKKIRIVPHGVDPSLFVPRNKPEKFTFVANKGWAQGIYDRGGVQWLLQAFCNEFKAGEQVELVIKINPAYCPPGWDLNNEIKKLNLPKDGASFKVNTSSFMPHVIPAFYEGDCFVSPTMAEAFSLPCIEAMSCGLPVITTGYGGQTDYVDAETGWLIDYDLVDVKHDVLYEGIKWAKPNIDHLRKLMRYAFEHREECWAKGRRAREKVLAGWTWDHSAEKLLNALKE